MSKKIKIAFVVFGGLSAGGTEKFLQTIAANLDKRRFIVSFFYCGAAPYIGWDEFKHPGTNHYRKQYLLDRNINIIEFFVGSKDLTSPFHNWKKTNFWEKFNENDFDIIQTGRAGHKEFPFNKIRKTPIVDSIHLTAGVDNQYNISRVMHICKWSADKWVKSGGDSSRVVLISHPMEINLNNAQSLRSELGLSSSITVLGFHQREADNIFSSIPLESYKKIESTETHFIIMGGSQLYKKQAAELQIKNISFLEHSADQERIFSFLLTLNIYAHGRKDGEVNSTAMAEAMYFGLPIVSHISEINNGHVECIADAGVVVDSVDAYAAELIKLKHDVAYYMMRSKNSKRRFKENYELSGQMRHIEDIYESVIATPFPHPVQRFLCTLHWTQNIRILLKWMYLKAKFALNGNI